MGVSSVATYIWPSNEVSNGHSQTAMAAARTSVSKVTGSSAKSGNASKSSSGDAWFFSSQATLTSSGKSVTYGKPSTTTKNAGMGATMTTTVKSTSYTFPGATNAKSASSSSAQNNLSGLKTNNPFYCLPCSQR